MIYVFLAEGFEEIEALATVDILRRGELDVCTVGVGGKQVTGAHGITVEADILEKDVSTDPLEAKVPYCAGCGAVCGGKPPACSRHLCGAFCFGAYGFVRGKTGRLFSRL